MNDPYFIDFVRSRDYREATIKVHRISLRDYCNLIGKTPTQIIDEAEKEEDDGIRRNVDLLKDTSLILLIT